MRTNFQDGFGYYTIDPGLVQTRYALDREAQIKCLLYLKSKIIEWNLAPQGAKFDIIELQYLGDPFPAIGMYTETYIDTPANLMSLAMQIGKKLETYISDIGTNRLRELSSA